MHQTVCLHHVVMRTFTCTCFCTCLINCPTTSDLSTFPYASPNAVSDMQCHSTCIVSVSSYWMNNSSWLPNTCIVSLHPLHFFSVELKAPHHAHRYMLRRTSGSRPSSLLGVCVLCSESVPKQSTWTFRESHALTTSPHSRILSLLRWRMLFHALYRRVLLTL